MGDGFQSITNQAELHARAVHEVIAGSTFVVIDGAGHVPSGQGHPDVARAFGDFARRVAR